MDYKSAPLKHNHRDANAALRNARITVHFLSNLIDEYNLKWNLWDEPKKGKDIVRKIYLDHDRRLQQITNDLNYIHHYKYNSRFIDMKALADAEKKNKSGDKEKNKESSDKEKKSESEKE